MKTIPDQSFAFYTRQIQPKRLSDEEEASLFEEAWRCQEAIVDGFLTLMYPLVQFLRLEMRVEEVSPSRHVPKDLRPKNRNSKMRGVEREAWVKLMQLAINHLFDGETEKLEDVKKDFRDLLLSDRDFNAYREIAEFIPLMNTEWVGSDVVEATVKSLGESFQAYYAIEEKLLPHVFAFARHQAMAKRRDGQPIDDYQQCALIGCITAIRKFDPRRELKFSTVAGVWIMGKLSRHINEIEPIVARDASFRNLQRDIKKVLTNYGLEWSDIAEDDYLQRRIATELQVPQVDIARFLAASRPTQSLHMHEGSDGDDEEDLSTDVYETVYAHDSSSSGIGGNPTSLVDASFLEGRIHDQMKKFDPKSHYLSAMTMGIGVNEGAMRLIDSYFEEAAKTISEAQIVKPSKRRAPMQTRIISDTVIEDEAE